MGNKRNTTALLLVVCCILIALCAFAVAASIEDAVQKVGFTAEVAVQDGVPDNAGYADEIIIEKDGTYQLRIEWLSAPGLITGVRLVDEAQRVVFWVTGESLDAESNGLALTKGRYTLEFAYMARAEAFSAFVLDCAGRTADGDPADGSTVSDANGHISDISDYRFASNGVWVTRYAYEIGRSGLHGIKKAAGVLCGAAVGMLLIVAVLVFTKKDGDIRNKFDERQRLARGRGYRAGFWTAIAYQALLAICGVLEIRIPADSTIIAFIGLTLSGFVFAVYCIWTDAYFALNENRRALGVAASLLGAANLAFGIWNLASGATVVDGVLTYRAVNLICGALIAAIGAALLIRKATARPTADGEDDAA